MPKDQIPMLIGIGAIIVTLATGTCSTNTRITDAVVSINQRMDDINQRMDDGFENMNRRIDDTNKRIDDLQTDVRELRNLVIEAIRSDTAEN